MYCTVQMYKYPRRRRMYFICDLCWVPSISMNSIGKTRDRLNHTLIYFRDSS